MEARAAGVEEGEGGSHGPPPPAGSGGAGRVARDQEEKEEQPLDSGDCLVQSVSDMDLIDHEPLGSGKPAALPHPQPTRLV